MRIIAATMRLPREKAVLTEPAVAGEVVLGVPGQPGPEQAEGEVVGLETLERLPEPVEVVAAVVPLFLIDPVGYTATIVVLTAVGCSTA